MSKNRPPFSIYETSTQISYFSQPRSSAFFIVGGVVTKVENLVRESDFALLSGEYGHIGQLSAHSEMKIPKCADIDDDSVWNGMMNELARCDVLPKSLESVSEEVSAIRWKAVSIISDQKLAKMAKEAERLAASAEKEAKRADKRRQNKLAKAEQPAIPETYRKHPVVLAIEKRLSRIAKTMNVYRYLDPTVVEFIPKPSLDEIADFVGAIEKAIYEVALEFGRKGANIIGKLYELLDLVAKAFPEVNDIVTTIPASSFKTPAKPIRQAENRV